jgi:hypothetical protein
MSPTICKIIFFTSLIYIFNLLHSTGLDSVFPHLNYDIKIAVTLSVSSCSTERLFSKMKLVKKD